MPKQKELSLQALKTQILEKFWSIKCFAQHIETSPATLSRIFREKKPLTPKMKARIIEGLEGLPKGRQMKKYEYHFKTKTFLSLWSYCFDCPLLQVIERKSRCKPRLEIYFDIRDELRAFELISKQIIDFEKQSAMRLQKEINQKQDEVRASKAQVNELGILGAELRANDEILKLPEFCKRNGCEYALSEFENSKYFEGSWHEVRGAHLLTWFEKIDFEILEGDNTTFAIKHNMRGHDHYFYILEVDGNYCVKKISFLEDEWLVKRFHHSVTGQIESIKKAFLMRQWEYEGKEFLNEDGSLACDFREK